jgi:formylglycine-generating enzyme required for sulfatase activity
MRPFRISTVPLPFRRLACALLVVLLGLGLTVAAVRACSVPVFRYALERWAAEPYELFIFHRGGLGPQDRKLADALQKLCEGPGATPNVQVQWVDVAGALDGELRKFWESQKPAGLPWAVLCYPRRDEERRVAWAGKAEGPALQPLFDSPARRGLAKRLLAGETAVWLFVEGGNAEKDGAALKLLEENLKVQEKELKLPGDDDGPQNDAPGQFRAALPLRIAFSTLRVARKDAAEQGLMTLLKNSFEKPPPEDIPWVFVLYGQGRVLAVLPGDKLEADSIGKVCEFLIGPCSCAVKDQRPGFDLLVLADWSALGGEPLVREPEVPNLAVLAPLLAAQALPGAEPAKSYPLWDGKETVAEYAKRAGLEPTKTQDLRNGVKLELALIPAGKFLMGSPETEKDRTKSETQHEVTITKPYYMGKYEVTQEQYEQVMGTNPSQFKGRDLPVEQVSWDDAQAFCKKASGKTGFSVRLPTEAQWERACRAGTETTYYAGDTEADLDRAGWYEKNSNRTTHPVGQKAANAWGLYDTHGNVLEWCGEWHGAYKAEAVVDPQGAPPGEYRVLRGGSWADYLFGCRSAFRGGDDPAARGGTVGFRVVVEVPRTP